MQLLSAIQRVKNPPGWHCKLHLPHDPKSQASYDEKTLQENLVLVMLNLVFASFSVRLSTHFSTVLFSHT